MWVGDGCRRFRYATRCLSLTNQARCHRRIRERSCQRVAGITGEVEEVGISDYSIFRREQDLVLVMRVTDFDAAWDALANDPVNLRWQAQMAKYLEPVPGLQPGERFAMMKEVFYME